MEKQVKNIARIYDLIESKAFNELSEEEKELVSQELAEAEYDKMHQTVSELEQEESRPKDISGWGLLRSLNAKVEIYKVAAVFLLLFTASQAFDSLKRGKGDELAIIYDTVYIDRIDTIVQEKIEVHEKLVYIQDYKEQIGQEQLKEANFKEGEVDCSQSLCASELPRLKAMQSRNHIHKDDKGFEFIQIIN